MHKIVRPADADKFANLTQHPISLGTAELAHGQRCHSVVTESTRLHDKKHKINKKHQITKENLYTVKMPRKCDVMPAIDIAQLIVSQRQRKREMAATLVLVCTGMSAVLL